MKATFDRSLYFVRLSDKTHERLSKHGKFNESFDGLVNRLLDIIEKKGK